jgi:hypothetical protein
MEFKFAPNVSQEQEGRAPTERLQQMVSEMHGRVKVSGSFPAPEQEQLQQEEEEKTPLSPTMPKLLLASEEKKAERSSEKDLSKRAKTKAPKSGSDGWWWSNVFFWFYFLALTTGFAVLLYHTQLSGPPGSAGRVQAASFTILTAAHDTRSIDLDLRQNYARPLLASLELSFYTHLSKSSAYACLCMHHMTAEAAVVKPPGQFRICSVYNRYMDRVHLMINPRIVGHGNKTDLYEESYASAPAKRFQNVPRYRHVFIQWSDIETGDDLTLQLNHMQAVCMQVALDEMK